LRRDILWQVLHIGFAGFAKNAADNILGHMEAKLTGAVNPEPQP
jgi:hypothetical protein